MVVFLSDITLLSYFKQNTIVFNLSSLYSGYNDVTSLITQVGFINQSNAPINLYIDTPEFDFVYSQNILGNNILFGAFMKIMSCVYEGINAVILIQRDPYRDAIMESIIKLIQVRYGYNCWIVEDGDDLCCIKESTFAPMGLLTLEEDIKRADTLCRSGVIDGVIDLNVSVE